MVQCVQFVDWASTVRNACRNDADGGAVFRGVAGGLGLLGVVTSVTLRPEVGVRVPVDDAVIQAPGLPPPPSGACSPCLQAHGVSQAQCLAPNRPPLLSMLHSGTPCPDPLSGCNCDVVAACCCAGSGPYQDPFPDPDIQ
jgi:hypothetical protein